MKRAAVDALVAAQTKSASAEVKRSGRSHNQYPRIR
jgi:hypothetical protein